MENNFFCVTKDSLFVLQEILQKENEKHNLINIGVVSDWENTVSGILKLFLQKDFKNDNFEHLKSTFLNFFYCNINYANFINTQKNDNPKLKYHIQYQTVGFIKQLQKEKKAILDIELQSHPLTIAYLPAKCILEEFYINFCNHSFLFTQPNQIIHFFQELSQEKYPIKLDDYISYLQNNDSSFWDVTCRYIKKIIKIVSLHHLYNKQNADLIEDEVWTDVYSILHKKLIQENIDKPNFADGNSFRNYIIKICRYRMLNVSEKHSTSNISIDDILKQETDDYYSNNTLFNEEPDDEIIYKELEIDTTNAFQVANAVAIILLNAEHPLYGELTCGLEDKIEILMNKVIKGMKYNEIVRKQKVDLNGEELEKAAAKARKDYERVVKTLTERLIKLIDKKNITFNVTKSQNHR